MDLRELAIEESIRACADGKRLLDEVQRVIDTLSEGRGNLRKGVPALDVSTTGLHRAGEILASLTARTARFDVLVQLCADAEPGPDTIPSGKGA